MNKQRWLGLRHTDKQVNPAKGRSFVCVVATLLLLLGALGCFSGAEVSHGRPDPVPQVEGPPETMRISFGGMYGTVDNHMVKFAEARCGGNWNASCTVAHGELPPGVSFDGQSCSFTGTPQNAGVWVVAVSFTNTHCDQASRSRHYPDRTVMVELEIAERRNPSK
jgi:hypothetical protein